MGNSVSIPYCVDISIESIDLLCKFFFLVYHRNVNIGVFGAERNGKGTTINSIAKAFTSMRARLVNEAEGQDTDTTLHRRYAINNLHLWDTRGLNG